MLLIVIRKIEANYKRHQWQDANLDELEHCGSSLALRLKEICTEDKDADEKQEEKNLPGEAQPVTLAWRKTFSFSSDGFNPDHGWGF